MSKIHPISSEADSIGQNSATSGPPPGLVFRNLLRLPKVAPEVGEPDSGRSRGEISARKEPLSAKQSIESILAQRKSFEDSGSGNMLPLEVFFQYVSNHSNEINPSSDTVSWNALNAFTQRIVSSLVSSRIEDVRLREALMELGYVEGTGWTKATFQAEKVLNSLSNIYLAGRYGDGSGSDYCGNESARREDSASESGVGGNFSNGGSAFPTSRGGGGGGGGSGGGKNPLSNSKFDALSFCPNVLFTQFPHDFDGKSAAESFDAAVLLADISGFSKFAGEMCLRGPKGLDALHRVTSDFLGHLVQTVYKYDGDVISFAGDALICIFPSTSRSGRNVSPRHSNVVSQTETVPCFQSLDDVCAQAIRCAFELRTHRIHTLSGHFAVSCGLITFALLGGVDNEWTYMMNGPCISELSKCIDDAQPQQVVCTAQCKEAACRAEASLKLTKYQESGNFAVDHINNLSGSLDSERAARGESGLASTKQGSDMICRSVSINSETGVTVSRANSNGNGFYSGRLPPIKKPGQLFVESTTNQFCMTVEDPVLLDRLVTKANHFIPKPVLNAMSAGTLGRIAELRPVTTMFLSLDSFSLTEFVDPQSLQPFFLLLQEVLKESGGFLRQFLIDDKGCVAIAMWGVPSYTHSDDSARGLYAAWNLWKHVATVQHRCSIGLTTGMVYCGIIGSENRRDYACIGDKVNIAARLMAKAKGRVLVDPDIFKAVDSSDRAQLQPYVELQLKGMPAPVTPYTFKEDANLSDNRFVEESQRYGNHTILRKEVVSKLLFVLDRAVVGTPFLSKLAVNDSQYHNSDLKSAILIGGSDRGIGVADSEKPEKNGNQTEDEQQHGPSQRTSLGERVGSFFRNSFVLRRTPSFQTNSEKSGSSRVSAHSQSIKFSGKAPSQFMMKSSKLDVSGKSSSILVVPPMLGTSKFSSSKQPSRFVLDGRGAAGGGPPVWTGLNYLFLIGNSGTGKSTAAQFFKQSAIRRKLRVVSVQGRLEDELLPYSILRKIFWELAGKSRQISEATKQQFVAEILEDVRQDDRFEQLAVSDRVVSVMTEILVGDSSVESHVNRLNEISAALAGVDRSSVARIDEEDWENEHHEKETFDENEGRIYSGRDGGIPHARTKSMDGQENTDSIGSTVSLSNYSYTNNVFAAMVTLVLSQFPATTILLLEDATYCDELSWITLQMLQEKKMKLIILFVVKQILTSTQAVVQMTPATKHKQSVSKGFAGEESKSMANSQGVRRSFSDRVVAGDSSKRGHAYQYSEAYAAILSHPCTTVIEMTDLSENEVKDVLYHVLGTHDFPPELVKKVLLVTSGNAFWVKAIARFIKEYGITDFIKTTDKGSAVDSLRNLIVCRLDKLSTEEQLVVKHSSVIGEEFSAATLQAILPVGLGESLNSSLASLVKHGFVYVVEADPCTIYAFHNQLTRETIYDLLPPSDASDIHIEVAKHILRRYHNALGPFYPSLSYHFTSCKGHQAHAFKYTIKAAFQAMHKGAYQNGLEFLKTAIRFTKTLKEVRKLLEVTRKGYKDLVRSGATNREAASPNSSRIDQQTPKETLGNAFLVLDKEIETLKMKLEASTKSESKQGLEDGKLRVEIHSEVLDSNEASQNNTNMNTPVLQALTASNVKAIPSGDTVPPTSPDKHKALLDGDDNVGDNDSVYSLKSRLFSFRSNLERESSLNSVGSLVGPIQPLTGSSHQGNSAFFRSQRSQLQQDVIAEEESCLHGSEAHNNSSASAGARWPWSWRPRKNSFTQHQRQSTYTPLPTTSCCVS